MPDNSSIFIPPFNHDGPVFDLPENRNKRAKLRNTVSELRWYAYRILDRHGVKSTPKTAIEIARNMAQKHAAITMLLEMLNNIATATPESADGRVQRTWIKMHNILDPILEQQNKQQ